MSAATRPQVGQQLFRDRLLVSRRLVVGVHQDVGVDEGADGLSAHAAFRASTSRAEALFVSFPRAVPPKDVICRLKSTDRPLRYLDEVENVMKARARRAKNS